MEPEGDGLGGVLQHFRSDEDAAVFRRHVLWVAHRARHRDAGQGVAYARGLRYVGQGGIAPAGRRAVHPERFARDGVVIPLPHAEFRALRAVPAIQGELLAAHSQRLADHGLGNPHVLARPVDMGPGVKEKAKRVLVGHMDAHLFEHLEGGLVDAAHLGAT